MIKLMRTTAYPGTVINRRSVSTAPQSSPPALKTIPFDYVFEFKLSGKSANNIQDVVKLQDVVEISMQGYFVGVSLGYSFVLDERKNPRSFGPVLGPSTVPRAPVLVPFFANTLDGELLSGAILTGMPESEIAVVDLNGQTVSTITLDTNGTATVTFETALNPDDGSLSAWDRTNNLLSERINLEPKFSTPIIGPDPATKQLPAPGDTEVTVFGRNGNVRILILDQSGNPIAITPESLENVQLSGNTFVGSKKISLPRPLAQGDTLLLNLEPSPGKPAMSSRYAVSRLRPSSLSLGSIMNGLTGIGIGQTSGFKCSQRFAPMFSANTPLDQIDPAILASAFEPACGQEDISFLYTIDVVSTGRELQNKPIHNIAGLGIANGDRPFRPFARPIAFEPRSVIRIQIEELSTLPGTLYIVLQGYKTLGTGRIPE